MTDLPGHIGRLAVFPLPGALLFPGMALPLHIFEQRYRAMVSEAMARDRLIGMIQPRTGGRMQAGEPAALFDVGCVGRMVDIEALDDGRYNIVLAGIARFDLVRELDVATSFRQVEARLWDEAEEKEGLAAIERSGLETAAREFAEAQGYAVDWDMVTKLDDHSLVNGVAQIAPFDAAAKQALLETRGLSPRCELLIQLMEFFGRRDGDENRVTLQ